MMGQALKVAAVCLVLVGERLAVAEELDSLFGVEKELTEAEELNRGVKHVTSQMTGSGAVGSLLGSSVQRRATIDPTNHPKIHFEDGEGEHYRGGVHTMEEAYRDEGRQITGANNLAKLVR